MKKIGEYTENGVTSELYEVSIDEIIEGLPKAIQEPVGNRWRREFSQWGDKLIVDKNKNERLFNLEWHCKNGAIIQSEVMQDDVTPETLATAFRECLQHLEYCIMFHHKQMDYIKKQMEEELLKSTIIPKQIKKGQKKSRIIPFKPH